MVLRRSRATCTFSDSQVRIQSRDHGDVERVLQFTQGQRPDEHPHIVIQGIDI